MGAVHEVSYSESCALYGIAFSSALCSQTPLFRTLSVERLTKFRTYIKQIGFPLRRPGFYTTAFHLEFVVEIMAL
jgi:hypothetical protein